MHLTTMAHLKTVADPHNYGDVSNFESAFCGRRVDTCVTDRSGRDPQLGHLGSSVIRHTITCCLGCPSWLLALKWVLLLKREEERESDAMVA